MTARELMNLMMGYPDYEVTSYIFDYNFNDNCNHDCANPESINFNIIDWYIDETAKEIVLELKQQL